jgi:hypothetical protein
MAEERKLYENQPSNTTQQRLVAAVLRTVRDFVREEGDGALGHRRRAQ